MERQHLKFHALANVFTRLQTSTHALLGQPSPKANNYKQLSFLDPLLFRFQITEALSELATTRHTHTYTYTNTPTHALTHPYTHLDRHVICIASELFRQAERLRHNTWGLCK